MSPTRAMLLFLLCAIATTVGFAMVAARAAELAGGDFGSGGLADGDPLRALLPLTLLTMVPALGAAWLLPRLRGEGATFLVVLAVGALVRALFVPIDPGLSDDVHRYLWDGRVQVAGINPYGVPPEDPVLDRVEIDWPPEERVRDRVNHPEIPTIYPPLLELFFGTVASVAGGVLTWKAMLLVAELLLVLLLVRALERRQRDTRAVLLYLWHPLPVIEVAWNAHAEVIGVALLLWCAVLLVEEGRWRAGIALGGAIAAKLLPIGYGVVLLRRGGVVAAILAAGTVAWLALPFAGVDPERAISGLGEYGDSWYFNDLIFRPLGELLGLQPEDRYADGSRALRLALGIVWIAVALATSGLSPHRAALVLVGAFVLLSPTVHPWYLLWVLPFAVIVESRGWWLLAGTTLIAYEVQIGWRDAGVWEEAATTRWLVYAAPIGLMLWSLRRQVLDRRLLRRLEAAASLDETS